MSSPPGLLLYGKRECGLCDEALALLAEAGRQACLIDVEADDELMARYGLRIPVLADGHQRELNWPFDEQALSDWLLAG